MADYRKIARQKAIKYGLDPDIFVKQIDAESGFNPRARSGAGALGIAQIMPDTARSWGVNPADPAASLDAAARNMARMVRKHGSYEAALRGYNAGEGAIETSKNFAETNNYVKKILGGSTPRLRAASGSARVTKTSPAAAPLGFTKSDLLKQYVLDRGKPGALTDLATGMATLKAAPKVAAPASPQVKASGSGSKLLELFWQGEGGVNVKNGKAVPQGFVSGHKDHVHVAAGPKTVVQLGKLAQQMGLHVGENPHFGKVNPVHTPTSYHYKGEAIDVSGDPKTMAAYARRVANMYGVK